MSNRYDHLPERSCGRCGGDFKPASPMQKRCKPCQKAFNAEDHIRRQGEKRRAAGARRAHGERPCGRCGKPFEAKASNAKICTVCRPLYEREKNLWNLAARRRRAGLPQVGELRPCSDCGLPFSYGGGPQTRCIECRKASVRAYNAAWAKAHGGSKRRAARKAWRHRREFGDGNRKAAIMRDGFACRACGTLDDLHVHHIDNRGKGRPLSEKNNTLENLITLCGTCHKRLHVATERLLYERHQETVQEALAAFLAAGEGHKAA